MCSFFAIFCTVASEARLTSTRTTLSKMMLSDYSRPLLRSGRKRASFIARYVAFFFSSRRRHTRYIGDWSSDVCSSDLKVGSRQTHPCRKSFQYATNCPVVTSVRGRSAPPEWSDNRAHDRRRGLPLLLSWKIGRASCRERV